MSQYWRSGWQRHSSHSKKSLKEFAWAHSHTRAEPKAERGCAIRMQIFEGVL